MLRLSRPFIITVMALSVGLAAGCPGASDLQQGGETDSTTFGIRGQTLVRPFGAAGDVPMIAGRSVTNSAAMRLFEQDPTEIPVNAVMRLPSSGVFVSPSSAGEDGARSALPLNGTFTVRVAVIAGASLAACSQAEFLAEYQVVLTTGVVTVIDEAQPLGSPARQEIAGNEVTICTEVTADFDGQLTLTDFELTFDGGNVPPTLTLTNAANGTINLLMPGEVFSAANAMGPGESRTTLMDDAQMGDALQVRAGDSMHGVIDSVTCPAIAGNNYIARAQWTGTGVTCTAEQDPTVGGDEPAESPSIQVPIDNRLGEAVAVAPTDTYGGIDYAVVGVLDATFGDAPVGTDGDTITVDLETVGLSLVETIHLATYSAWVPDMENGITIAELTLRYAGQGSETIPLVLGADTAEWSYDRPEYGAQLGGVRHSKPNVLYSFDTTLDSASEYPGHVYGARIDLDPPRSLSRLTLTIADGESLGLRPDALHSGDWVRQSVPAVTLVGPPAGTVVDPGDIDDDEVEDDDGGDVTDDSEPEVTGAIAGAVIDAVSSTSLSNAFVTVVEAGATAIADGSGGFQFPDLHEGAYTLNATLSGYVAGSATVIVVGGETAVTSLALFAECTVFGTVVDAQTGEPLNGVLVSVDGTAASDNTDSSGEFTIENAPQGQRTLTATLAGYVPSSVPVTVDPEEDTEVSLGLLVIGGGGDGVAVVLSWGSTPRDLDLHVSGPDGGGRFHIAFYSLNPVAHASLDLDDTSSFGPETVTISPTSGGTYVAGDYHVWIHNYSRSPEFNGSNGLVTLYAGGAQFGQYQVSNATGDGSSDIWRVVEFSIAEDGTVEEVTPLESFEEGTSQSVY